MLDKLALHSRVWIFQANRILNDQECSIINDRMQHFIPTWASHGNEIYGDYYLASSLFLIVGADETKSPTSGCSIDTLTREVKTLGEQLNVDFFDRLRVAYEQPEGHIQLLPLQQFKEKIHKDLITQGTIVYNNLIETKADLDTKWRTHVRDSWHKNLLLIR